MTDQERTNDPSTSSGQAGAEDDIDTIIEILEAIEDHFAADLPADVPIEADEEPLFDLIGILADIDGGECDDPLGDIIAIVAKG